MRLLSITLFALLPSAAAQCAGGYLVAEGTAAAPRVFVQMPPTADGEKADLGQAQWHQKITAGSTNPITKETSSLIRESVPEVDWKCVGTNFQCWEKGTDVACTELPKVRISGEANPVPLLPALTVAAATVRFFSLEGTLTSENFHGGPPPLVTNAYTPPPSNTLKPFPNNAALDVNQLKEKYELEIEAPAGAANRGGFAVGAFRKRHDHPLVLLPGTYSFEDIFVPASLYVRAADGTSPADSVVPYARTAVAPSVGDADPVVTPAKGEMRIDAASGYCRPFWLIVIILNLFVRDTFSLLQCTSRQWVFFGRHKVVVNRFCSSCPIDIRLDSFHK